MDQETPANFQNLPLVLAVDLGGTQIRAAVLQGATLLSRVGMLTGENPTPDRIIPRVYKAIEQALDEAHCSLQQMAGIGIGAPGPLDSRTGVVLAPPNLPSWDRVPLGNLFSEQYKIPVFVENDANAGALAEYIFGAGRGCKDMVYLTVSTGIGGGVIIDGILLAGASCTAGELGHMTIDWKGERCTCGNIGCLEYLASGTAIARRANEEIAAGRGTDLLAFARTMQDHAATIPDPSALPVSDYDESEYNDQGTSEESFEDSAQQPSLRVNARTVARAAEAGVPLAREIITSAAEALGVGLVNIVHAFNPERIILGGGVIQMGPMLLEPALRIVQERAMQVPRDAVRIMSAQLGANVGLIGAGAIIYYRKMGAQLSG